MKAIILAAGRSTRLYPLTLEKPKSLLEVDGQSIIGRQLDQLEALGIADVVVVTGYRAEVIQRHLGDRVRYRHFDGFAGTNHLHTLHSVRDELDGEVLCLFADVIVEKEILSRLVERRSDYCLVVDPQVRPGTMRVKIRNGQVLEMGNQIRTEDGDGTFIGIARYSERGAGRLAGETEVLVGQGNEDQYYTLALQSLAAKGEKIAFINTGNSWWTEIDTKEDFDAAVNYFIHKKEKQKNDGQL